MVAHESRHVREIIIINYFSKMLNSSLILDQPRRETISQGILFYFFHLKDTQV